MLEYAPIKWKIRFPKSQFLLNDVTLVVELIYNDFPVSINLTVTFKLSQGWPLIRPSAFMDYLASTSY